MELHDLAGGLSRLEVLAEKELTMPVLAPRLRKLEEALAPKVGLLVDVATQHERLRLNPERGRPRDLL
jgi:hypothetical protein